MIIVTKAAEKKEYYPGIDILRIISMFFIISIHTLQHGGVLNNVVLGTGQYYSAEFIYTVVNSGVDIFALISGFVGYREEFRHPNYKKFVELWSRAVFYSIIVAVIIGIVLGLNIGIKDIVKILTPVTSDSYWYFTSYFFVMCLGPCLNWLVKSVVEKNIYGSLILGYICLLLSHRITGLFSIVLLLYLYYVGAYIRKARICTNIKINKYVTGIILIILFNYICTILFESKIGIKAGGFLLRYDSPTLILNAVFWLMTFQQIRIKKGNALTTLRIVSPAVFSAYLINDNPYMRRYFITNRFVKIMNLPVASFVLEILLFGVVFLAFSICVDLGREWLFKKIQIYRGMQCCEKNTGIFLGNVEKKILKIIK